VGTGKHAGVEEAHQGVEPFLVRADHEAAQGVGEQSAKRVVAFLHPFGVGAARCADSVDPKELGSRIGEVVNYFNGDFLKEMATSGAELRPITPEEATPSRVEGRAEVFAYWETPRTRKLLMDLKQLRFGSEEQQTENNKKARRSDGLGQFLTTEQRSERAASDELLGALGDTD